MRIEDEKGDCGVGEKKRKEKRQRQVKAERDGAKWVEVERE